MRLSVDRQQSRCGRPEVTGTARVCLEFVCLAARSNALWTNPSGIPPRGWLAAVRREERRGELLSAFDVAERGLEEHPDDLALKHRAVLALARAGATEEAARRFDRYGLGRARTRTSRRCGLASQRTSHLPARAASAGALRAGSRALRRDLRAYRRVLPGDQRGDDVADRRRSGSRPRAAARCRRPRAHAENGRTGPLPPRRRRSFCAVTDAAARALERAATLHGGDYGALATTRRQLRMICEIRGIDPSMLSDTRRPRGRSLLRPPDRGAGEPGRFPPAAEEAVAARIKEVVGRDMPATRTAHWQAAPTSCGPRRCSPLELRCMSCSRSLGGVHRRVGRAVRAAAGSNVLIAALTRRPSVRFATDDAFLR